jgi:hypothetical protein
MLADQEESALQPAIFKIAGWSAKGSGGRWHHARGKTDLQEYRGGLLAAHHGDARAIAASKKIRLLTLFCYAARLATTTIGPSPSPKKATGRGGRGRPIRDHSTV